jgi:hypothetical protein
VKNKERTTGDARWCSTDDIIEELKARFPSMVFVGFIEDPNENGQPTVVLYNNGSLGDGVALAMWAQQHLTGATVGKMITDASDKQRAAKT